MTLYNCMLKAHLSADLCVLTSDRMAYVLLVIVNVIVLVQMSVKCIVSDQLAKYAVTL